jgi:hypothetical protein
LYIIPSSGQNQVGFVATNGTAPADAVTTGFAWIGNSVAYAGNTSDFQSRFWAQSTNQTGLWTLLWNTEGTAIDSASPVILKTSAPTKPTRMWWMVTAW